MCMVDAKKVKEMMLVVCQTEIDKKEELCRLDAFVGDGDHGYTVERGFTAVKNILEVTDFETPSEVFSAVGETLSESMGGAIGLIMGGLYTGGIKRILNKEKIGKVDWGFFLEDGLEQIKKAGGAKEGDRTLIDALSPATAAYQAAVSEGETLTQCWEKAAAAAERGAMNTAEMIAKKGRARFLQEKSLGHIDAGATTMQFMIAAMSKYICETVSQNQ